MIRHNILDIFNERIYELGIKQKYIAEKMNITQDRLYRIPPAQPWNRHLQLCKCLFQL